MRADDVLTQIDNALHDYDIGPDAMRSAPDLPPPPVTPPRANGRNALIQRLIDRHGLDADTARAAVLDAERGHDTEHARLAAREARAAMDEIHTHFRAGFRALAERVTEQVRHVSEQFAQLKEAIQQLPEPACTAHGKPVRRRDRPAWQSPYGPAPRRR